MMMKLTLCDAPIAGAGNPLQFVLNNGPGMQGGLYDQVRPTAAAIRDVLSAPKGWITA